MDVRERRCGLCGQVNPTTSEFCADAALLALWFGGASGIAAPVFIVGLLSVLIGFLRLRRDDRIMARAGTATVVVSSVVLGAALAQTLGFAGSQVAPPATAMA